MFTFSSCNIESLHEEEQATATDNIEGYVANVMDTTKPFTKHLTRLQINLAFMLLLSTMLSQSSRMCRPCASGPPI